MPRIQITEGEQKPATSATDFNPESVLFKDGGLTTEGAAVMAFLDTVDFAPIFEEVADLCEEGVAVVSVDEDGNVTEHDLTEAELAAFVALDEAGSYKAMSRGEVLARMKNARMQTADERLKNRKKKMWRRKNRAKVALGSKKRMMRVGAKAEKAAQRRGLGEGAEINYVSITAPSDLVESAIDALKTAGLIDEVILGSVTEGATADETLTTFEVQDDIAEGVAAWMQGADLIAVDELTNEVIVAGADESIDMDDLGEMFLEHLDDLAGSDSITDRATASLFESLFTKEGIALDEATKAPWKKGDFKKIHKGKIAANGQKGPVIVNRMLGAMIHKVSIKKVAPGTGYTGGDYAKDAGYGPGTASGIKKWQTYLAKGKQFKGKGSATQVAKAKTAAKQDAAAAKSKTVPTAGKKAIPADKKAALAKLLKGKGKGKASGKVEGDETQAGKPQVNESETPRQSHSGASLSAGLLARTPAQPTGFSKPQVSESKGMSGASMARAILGRTQAKPVGASMAKLHESSEVLKALPVAFTAIGEDYGVMYAPGLTEGDLRAKAKAAGFEKLNSNKMSHPKLTEATLVFLKDRCVIAPK